MADVVANRGSRSCACGDWTRPWRRRSARLASAPEGAGAARPLRGGDPVQPRRGPARPRASWSRRSRRRARPPASSRSSPGRRTPRWPAPLLVEAGAELAAGRGARALPLAERALALREAGRPSPRERAEARFATARALAASGQRGERALELARSARDLFRAQGRGVRGRGAGGRALARAAPLALPRAQLLEPQPESRGPRP